MTDEFRLDFVQCSHLVIGVLLFLTSLGASAADIVIDDLDANTYRTGNWDNSGGPDPYGAGSIYSKSGDSTFSWHPALPVTGTYAVYAWWTHRSNRSTNVPYQIEHNGGVATVIVDQRDKDLAGQWQLLGQYSLTPGANGQVTVTGKNGPASADAVRFVLQGASAPTVPADNTPTIPAGDVELVMDNGDRNTVQIGKWSVSSGPNPFGVDSIYSKSGNSTFSWEPTLPVTGTYDIYAWWTHHSKRSTNVPFRIEHDEGVDTAVVNQRDANLAGQWQLLGRYRLTPRINGRITVSGENGQASADAVRFVLTDGGSAPPRDNDPGNGTRSGTLSWSPPTSNTDGTALRNLAAYRIRAGTAPANLNQVIEINNPQLSDYVIEDLTAAVWYFEMTAVNREGIESEPSNRISIDLRY